MLARRLSFTDNDSYRLVVIMVGLPARGKSYISQKIHNYLRWRGHKARVFNVGEHRRERHSGNWHDAAWFGDGQDKTKRRDEIAREVLTQVATYMASGGGQVALFDATNSTRARRQMVSSWIKELIPNAKVMFVESICDDPQVVTRNIRTKIKRSPDYVDIDPEVAEADLRKRIENYRKRYDELQDDEDLSYVKVINLQSKVIAYKMTGQIQRTVLSFLMNLRVNPNRKIWLVRTADVVRMRSFDHSGSDGSDPSSDRGSIGSDEDEGGPRAVSDDPDPFLTASRLQADFQVLSARGQHFSQLLANFVSDNVKDSSNVHVWTSTAGVAAETVKPLLRRSEIRVRKMPALNMIHKGVCYGLPDEQVEKDMPGVFRDWMRDPFRYRFTGGESYQDVVSRVEPVLLDMEQLDWPCMIVSHLSVLRLLYSYFTGKSPEKAIELRLKRGFVYEFTPSLYGWKSEHIDLMASYRDSREASPAINAAALPSTPGGTTATRAPRSSSFADGNFSLDELYTGC